MQQSKWIVDATTEPGLLICRFHGRLTAEDVRAFVEEHNRAVDGMQGRDQKVWVDLRELQALGPDAAQIMKATKRPQRPTAELPLERRTGSGSHRGAATSAHVGHFEV